MRVRTVDTILDSVAPTSEPLCPKAAHLVNVTTTAGRVASGLLASRLQIFPTMVVQSVQPVKTMSDRLMKTDLKSATTILVDRFPLPFPPPVQLSRSPRLTSRCWAVNAS